MLPSSGLTTTTSFPGSFRLWKYSSRIGAREEVIDGHVEKALNLGGVQVHRQHAVGARRRDQVGDELGRDRHTARIFAVLPRIAEVRDARP